MADDDAVARWNALSLEEREARLAASWTPEAEAEHQRIVRGYLETLPDALGTFGGHLVTDVCYRPGGCGPGCPVWVGEAEDARGPN